MVPAGLSRLLYSLYVLGPGSNRALREYAWIRWYESASEDARKAARDELFRRLVQFAYDEVPFYHRLYDAHAVDLKGINGVEDIAKLPPVSREMLAAAPLSEIRPRQTRKLVFKSYTSGSSGRPLAFYRSLSSILYTGGRLLHYLESWGRPEARKVFFILHAFDPTLSVNLYHGHRFSFLNRRHSISPFLPADRIIERMQSGRPEVVVAFPSALLDLALRYRERGRRYEKSVILVTSGEMMTENMLDRIADAFPGFQWFDLYAAAETGFIAAHCACSDLLHINEDSIIVEEGESAGGYTTPVITNLRNRGTPFIRYTGVTDLLRLAEAETCGCGGSGRLIKSIAGRAADRIAVSRTKAIPAAELMTVHARIPGIQRLYYAQPEPGTLILRYVPRSGSNPDEVAAEAEELIRGVVGQELRFSVEAVERLRRSRTSSKVPLLVRES